MLPGGVGVPGATRVRVVGRLVLYTVRGDEDVVTVRGVVPAWRRARREEFGRRFGADWASYAERVRAGAPAVERVLDVADRAGLSGAAGAVYRAVTFYPVSGVCVLQCLSGAGAGVRLDAAVSDGLVGVEVDGVNHGRPWRLAPAAAVDALGRVLAGVPGPVYRCSAAGGGVSSTGGEVG